MTKLNNKGFISTTIVYAFFVLFLLLLLLLLNNYKNNRQVLTIEKNDIKSSLKFCSNSKLLYESILENNGGTTAISAKGTPNFSIVATTNEGMYAASDDYGTSYYFRGSVNNNWVLFAGFYWRIIRVNGDNTVRMIYSGTTAPTESQAVVMTGTGTQIGMSAFNNSYYDNMYVGYMYNSGEVHGYATDSTIKGIIDTWYTNNLTSYSYQIANSVYCNDRSPSTINGYINDSGGTGVYITYYRAYFRLDKDKTPQLNCVDKSDAFTTSNDTTYGNGHLANPIGLITADEISMAGGLINNTNSLYYLYTNQNYWTGSPYYFYCSPGCYAYEFDEETTGFFGYSNVDNYTSGIRPVISLKSGTKISSGSGTYNDPYVVNEC
jgi:hypothetical protein